MSMVILPRCSGNVITNIRIKFIKYASKTINITKQNKDKGKDRNNANANVITLTNVINTVTLHRPANQKPTTPITPNRNKIHIP